MLTAVKNQIKVTLLSFKYDLMKSMLNKVSFLSNVIFMIFNNASFLILWVIFYSLKDNIGGATIKDVFLLWGLSAGGYGLSHVIFNSAYNLGTQITNGKLDAYLVQPKNVLLGSISGVSPSAIGDILYAYILLVVSRLTIKKFVLYTLFMITGSLILTAVAVIVGSLSFWITNSEAISSSINGMMTQFSTYPEGIFSKNVKILLYFVIPVGYAVYLPVSIINAFNLNTFIITLGITVLLVVVSFIVFYKGLRKYSSSNLMIAKI